MKLRITQSHIGYTVKRRGRDNTSKCARNAITSIVGHYQHNVGCALRRHHLRRPVGFRAIGVEANLTAERLRRGWQIVAVNGGGRARGTRDAARFLCTSARRYCHPYEKCKRQQKKMSIHRQAPFSMPSCRSLLLRSSCFLAI